MDRVGLSVINVFLGLWNHLLVNERTRAVWDFTEGFSFIAQSVERVFLGFLRGVCHSPCIIHIIRILSKQKPRSFAGNGAFANHRSKPNDQPNWMQKLDLNQRPPPYEGGEHSRLLYSAMNGF